MKSCHLIVHHDADGEVAYERFKQDEQDFHNVNGPFHGEDVRTLIEEEEEDERELDEKREQPAAG